LPLSTAFLSDSYNADRPLVKTGMTNSVRPTITGGAPGRSAPEKPLGNKENLVFF
jgi:hypothetical protein